MVPPSATDERAWIVIDERESHHYMTFAVSVRLWVPSLWRDLPPKAKVGGGLTMVEAVAMHTSVRRFGCANTPDSDVERLLGRLFFGPCGAFGDKAGPLGFGR